MGKVDFGGVLKRVCLEYIPEVAVGEYAARPRRVRGSTPARRGRSTTHVRTAEGAGRTSATSGRKATVKFLDEYRDPAAVARLLDAIRSTVTRPWVLMEVCGGQTHSVVRHGLDELLSPEVELVHGPGCPVCVTPLELIDRALEIASRPGVIFCSFGDMLRVPGSHRDLFAVKAAGGDVRVVYSPLDCLKLAEANPDRTVVFFAVGFETTAPANAMAVKQAKARGLTNFAVLMSHVLVPPAMEAILSSPNNRVHGFLAAGHVCTVMGTAEYEPLAERYRVPVVVTGFEPVDLLEGVLRCVTMLKAGRWGVEGNAYARVLCRLTAIAHARAVVEDVFEITDRKWRGIGTIAHSGYRLRQRSTADFDAETALRGIRYRGRRIQALPERIGSARAEEAARVPRVWQGMHPADTAGRDDGFFRRSVRRVLSRRPLPGAVMPDFANLSCPAPRSDTERVLLGHGSGGRLSAELLKSVFLPAFGNDVLNALEDQATRSNGVCGTNRVHDGFVCGPAAVLPRWRHRPARGERDR